MVLLRNGAGFTSLKGNSKQSCHFTKKHMEMAPFCIERSMKTFNGFSLFLHSSYAVYWTLDRYFLLALNVSVWSSHAVINSIGNHLETHFVKFLFF